MWVAIDYEPVAAFGLRPSNTTSNGGKSLICPTPYGIKMALLDRLIRFEGVDVAVSNFPVIRDLKFWLRLPYAIAVNRTFQRVLTKDLSPSISQREYCFHAGTLTMVYQVESDPLFEFLPLLLSAINYFGRRGSFFQYANYHELDTMPVPQEGFVDICSTPVATLSFGFLQRMDDMRPDALFEDVSTFSSRFSKDGGRIYRNIVFPYQLKHHGLNHTVYESTIKP